MSAFHGFALHLQDCHNNKLAWKQILFSTLSYSRFQGHAVFEKWANLVLLVLHSHHRWWASNIKRATGLGKRFPIFVKYCDVWYFECYPSICVTAPDNVWLISACQDCQVKTFFSITKVPAAEMLCDAGLWWIMRPMRGVPPPAPALLLTSHSSLRNFLYTRIFMLMRPKYCSLTI